MTENKKQKQELAISTTELNANQQNNNIQAILAGGVEKMLVQGKDFDLDLISGIIRLQQEINKQQSEQEFYVCFSKMSSEIGIVKKDTKGVYNKKYASISAIIQAISTPLKDNGFCLTHSLVNNQFITTLAHRTGHKISTTFSIQGVDLGEVQGIHAQGGIRTYAKRYNILDILNIATDENENDDVNNLVENSKEADKLHKKQEIERNKKIKNKSAAFIAAVKTAKRNGDGIDYVFGVNKEPLGTVFRKLVAQKQDGSEVWDEAIACYEKHLFSGKDNDKDNQDTTF